MQAIRGVVCLLVTAIAIGALAPPASAQQIVTVPVRPDGSPSTGEADFSGALGMSADGFFALFQSTASDLGPNDTNGVADVYVRDLRSNVTVLASIGNFGERVHLEDPHFIPVRGDAISADGRWVLFETESSLVADDNNQCTYEDDDGVHPVGCQDVYLRDVGLGKTTLVSRASNGTFEAGAVGNGHSSQGSMSADGRFILFFSQSTNLAPGTPPNTRGLYLHDVSAGTTRRLDLPHAPLANAFISNARISGDGSAILYTYYSLDPDPACGALTSCAFVAVADKFTGAAEVLNIPTPANLRSMSLDLSGFSFDGHVALIFRTLFAKAGGITNDYVFVQPQLSHIVYLPAPDGSTPMQASLETNGRAVLYPSGPSQAPSHPRLSLYNDNAHQSFEVLGPPTLPLWTYISQAVLSTNGSRVLFLGIGNLAGQTVTPIDNVYTFLLDTDSDGMPDAWEKKYGLNPNDATDALADPDNDGKNNLQEYQFGTHPRGTFTRYLAEGSTNAVFSTRIAIFNPGATPATALVHFQGPHGPAAPSATPTIPAHSRITIDPDPYGMGDFSTVVESDALLVVDRTMSVHDIGHGSQGETSVSAPSKTWFFAEGATGGPFSLYYLLQNPGDVGAQVTVKYLLEGAAPLTKTYAVDAHARVTIWVDQEDPALASANVSAKITADQPIVAERSLYLASLGQPLGAVEGGAGATAPETRWFLAEGATGSFFDLYVLLANAETTDANVTLTYLLADGTHFSKSYVVSAQSRRTILVDDEDPRLKDAAVSVVAESTNAVPIVVERAMWWPEGNWYEGHLSLGATATARKWALAEGEIGGPQNAQDYVLIANTSNTAGTATVTVYVEGGGAAFATRVIDLPANSRTNVPVASLLPANNGLRVAVTVESPDADLVVERSQYWDVNGITWAAGTASLGTPIP